MQFLLKTTLFIALLATFNLATAQKSIIVVNGGIFGSVNANTTIEDLGSGSLTNMGEIGVTSIQDIVVENQYAYVAAQDSIVKYDWVTKTRVAANAFGGVSTVKLAIHGSQLLVGNWYEPFGWTGPYDNHFRIFNTTDLTFVDSIPEVTKAAKDFVVVGDFAYIAQNNAKTVGWGDTLGYLAVVDLTTASFVRYDTLSTTGDAVGRMVVEGNMIYTINNDNNSISSYNTLTMAKTTLPAGTDLNAKSNGPTAFTDGAGVWYFPFDSGIGSYNLSTNTIITPNILNISGSFAFVMDTSNNTFCVSHINYASQTDNTGRIYDMNGDSVGMFQVGFSPEALAIVSNTVIGSSTKLASAAELKYSIYPNPVSSILNIDLEKAEAVTIILIDQLGQTVLEQKTMEQLTVIDIEQYAAGLYFIAVVNEEGLVRTQQFVKK